MKKSVLTPFFVVVGLVFFGSGSPPPAQGWEANVHASVVKDSARIAPPGLRELLETWDDRDTVYPFPPEYKKMLESLNAKDEIRKLEKAFYPPFTQKRMESKEKSLKKKAAKGASAPAKEEESPDGAKLEKYPKGALERGAVQPDADFRDYFNHVYHFSWMAKERAIKLEAPGEILKAETREYRNYTPKEGGATKRGNAVYHIAFLCDEISRKIKSGEFKDADLAWALGVIGHYVADMNQPTHTVQKTDYPHERKYHTRYEHDLMQHLTRAKKIFFGFDVKAPPAGKSFEEKLKMSLFDGFQYIDDPVSHFEKRVAEVNPFVEKIDKAYLDFSGEKPQRKEGWAEVEKESYRFYARAINDILDVWFTIWVRAGKCEKGSVIALDLPGWNTRFDSALGEFSTSKININSCTVGDLQGIRGCGKKTAEKIVQNRPYKTLEDLLRVIPAKKFDEWRNQLTLQ